MIMQHRVYLHLMTQGMTGMVPEHTFGTLTDFCNFFKHHRIKETASHTKPDQQQPEQNAKLGAECCASAGQLEIGQRVDQVRMRGTQSEWNPSAEAGMHLRALWINAKVV